MTNLIFGLMAAFGIIYTSYGLLILFNKKFFNKLSSTIWNEFYKNNSQEKHAHFYNKYARGVGALIVGGSFAFFGIIGLLGI